MRDVVAGLLDEPAGVRVQLGRHSAGPDLLSARILDLSDLLMQLTLPGGGVTDDDSARHVRVVAVDERAEVHLHEVSALEDAVGRLVVRSGAVGPDGHNVGEAWGRAPRGLSL